ncbi:MAG TPA: hypothetical protein VJJ02_01935 [Candidatus Paceibacterota bacterium]
MIEVNQNTEKEPATKEQVVQALREQSPEARELLQQWTIAREAKVENNLESRIKFELERAELYGEAGFEDDADLSIDAAIEQAENEGRPDLVEEIVRWAKMRIGTVPS